MDHVRRRRAFVLDVCGFVIGKQAHFLKAVKLLSLSLEVLIFALRRFGVTGFGLPPIERELRSQLNYVPQKASKP